MSPTLGPDPAPVHSPIIRGRSTASLRSSSSRTSTTQVTVRSPARSLSSSSIMFDDEDIAVVREEGLRHSKERLEARRYKSPAFAEKLVGVLHTLRVPHWHSAKDIAPQNIEIHKVSGSLTNAVFFVSCTSHSLPKLLLRIYGPSSGTLINRARELHTLHVLSSQYHIGPRVYGTFENGRIEEYFNSSALTASDLRDPQVSSWIGARMAELHQVDVAAVEEPSLLAASGEVRESQLGARKNVETWLLPAREVLSLPSVTDAIRQELDLDLFEAEWKEYLLWLKAQEQKVGASRRVFAHNDTQYGNLLRLNSPTAGLVEHRQIIVVDFEYASPNPAAFDIANHFHEWTANYHADTPHVLHPDRYPTVDQRRNFYRTYIMHSTDPDAAPTNLQPDNMEVQIEQLDKQVRMWSPASHGMWALWGLVQAREFLEGQDGEPEFDYVGYARCRMESFRRELRELRSV
ncbi:kinase-like protein [Cristinia sonorae]|uniref:Kinase-like protein n=1 Tax=Cristinia sonorae TaxID=1940300 RepID=A0A8K0UND3_9AGAR|nr:kinase-like protein [Cristinia sonorae]